ncbi:MAG: hypothetical protein EZS28_045186, partial [Streblomastix strix]
MSGLSDIELKKKIETIDELEEKLKGCETEILDLEAIKEKNEQTIADLLKQLAQKNKVAECENCSGTGEQQDEFQADFIDE